jgi:hypothetical protein
MRTRNIVLLIIIIILVLFGILFLSDKISDSGLIEPVNGPFRGFSCSKDSDCALQQIIACCGGESYYHDSCFNVDYKPTTKTKSCEGQGCSKVLNAQSCKCENNKCVGLFGFVEDQKVVLYLPNRVAEIKQGKKLVMAFGIQNVIKEQKFRWEINVNDADISRKCGVREQEAERWVTTGRVGRAEIASGKSYYDFATFNIPEGSVSDISTCVIRYELVVIQEEDGGIYEVEIFDVDII